MFRRFFRRRPADSDLDDEIRFYLDQETQLRIDRGESPEQARLHARRDFGNVLRVRETTREVWAWTLIENLLRDLRFGARLMLRSPIPSTVAILSLALGIGANTAIFSLMDLVMLRSLPVHEPHRLVQLQKLHADATRGGLSYPMLEDLRRQLRSYDGLLAQSGILIREVVLSGPAEAVKVQLVSDNYFEVLGVDARLGRVFTAGHPGPSAVVSHRFWRRRFASDHAALGAGFQLGKVPITIVGVAPPDFFGTVAGESADIFVPISMDSAIRGGKSWTAERGISWLSVLGRLRPGVTIEQAAAESAAVFPAVLDAHKDARAGRARDNFLAQRLAVYPAARGFDDLRRRFSEPLRILMGVVALVLLIACANIANLLLARSAARRREISVRLAIGAGPGRIVRQLLAEGFLLAGIGGGLGLALALGFGNWLVAMMSNGGERMALQVRPDPRILAFAAAVSLASCLLVSLVPALQAVRANVTARWRLGRGLVVAQVAISLLLLIAAGLFGRTLYNIYAQDVGFNRHGVLTFSLNASKAGYKDEALAALYTSVLADLRTLPGVSAVSAVVFPPFSGYVWDSSLTVEGYTPVPDESNESSLNVVGPDYFRTMGTPVLAGREFDERDGTAARPAAVVNESFARHYFRGGSPIGRTVIQNAVRYEIIGVVKDTKYRNLRQASPRIVYFAATQRDRGRGWDYIVVRSAANPRSLLRSIEAVVQRRNDAVKVVEPLTLDDMASRSLLHERMLATLAAAFGGLAVILSAVGIYGVMAFQVARRRKEIGIRVALGAKPHDVVRMLVAQAARLALAGAAIGVPCALLLTRFTEKTLFGITPNDPATIIGAVLGISGVAILAAYLPGRAATRIDPLESLRCD